MKKRKGLNVVDLQGEYMVQKTAQLYDTIIFLETDDTIKLNSGGFRTNHTKNCINDLLPSGFKVYQRDFTWYVVTPCSELSFTDNMVLDLKEYEV